MNNQKWWSVRSKLQLPYLCTMQNFYEPHSLLPPQAHKTVYPIVKCNKHNKQRDPRCDICIHIHSFNHSFFDRYFRICLSTLIGTSVGGFWSWPNFSDLIVIGKILNWSTCFLLAVVVKELKSYVTQCFVLQIYYDCQSTHHRLWRQTVTQTMYS